MASTIQSESWIKWWPYLSKSMQKMSTMFHLSWNQIKPCLNHHLQLGKAGLLKDLVDDYVLPYTIHAFMTLPYSPSYSSTGHSPVLAISKLLLAPIHSFLHCIHPFFYTLIALSSHHKTRKGQFQACSTNIPELRTGYVLYFVMLSSWEISYDSNTI